MSNYQDWDDDDDFDIQDEETQQRPATGNDLVKKLRRAQRAAEKRAKELEEELSSLRNVNRESTVKGLLSSFGLDAKVAKLIPSDVEPTEEGISAWIQEYSDVFGLQVQQENPNINQNLQSLRQIDQVVENAYTPEQIDNVFLRLDQAQSAEDIINMINNG